jgi:type VI secretion system protein ImpL
MTAFAYELATLLQAQEQATGGHPDGAYALPWYLVLGEPGTGRSTAIKALNLSWPRGDQPVQMQMPEKMCSYWIPEKAVFIEPESNVVGPARSEGRLAELCAELMVKRPREPIDGIVVVVNAELLADSGERATEEYGKQLRRYLVEVAQALGADVPSYVVVTGYDGLWGFGDAFQWTPERRDEEPWGFALPVGMPAEQTPDRVREELEGLLARVESVCFAKLSSDDTAEARTRAFQHLAEARDLMLRLGEVMKTLTMGNAFERAPWIRALIMGGGLPGTGHKLRHNAQYFSSMGMALPQQSGTAQPGGMPMHALLDAVLIPERDIVPTKLRWRDDKLSVALWVLTLLAVLCGAAAWAAMRYS